MSGLKENVKKYAAEKGIPVYKLEEEMGIAKGSISKWNEIKPSADKVVSVSKILGISVEKLFTCDENHDKNGGSWNG